MPGLVRQEDLLDLKYRKLLIKEITGQENVNRKMRALRAHEIYKDKVRKWVIESLSKEFSAETVVEMVNRASNISILKKVINKLARAYSSGVTREAAEAQKQVDALTKLLDFNTKMKKSDRLLHLHKNLFVYVVPELEPRQSQIQPKYSICVKPLSPHLFDVVPWADNPERAGAVILTDFIERDQSVLQTTVDGRPAQPSVKLSDGDGVEQNIANSPSDAGKEHREFIVWSDKYHFTMDENGKDIALKTPIDYKNPVGSIPGEFFHDDRDGSFWAEGGDDLVDGAVLINIELTDLYAIKNCQGWGQPVITGKNIPKKVQGGPHRAIILEHQEGEPTPTFSYVSSNPPLGDHMKSIEMTTALYLSTNNLSPTSVAGKLDAANFPSGIAKMVEDAQSTEPVEDKQGYYKDMEPLIWEHVARWQNLLFEKKALTEDFTEVGKIPDGLDVQLQFMQLKQVVTEGEKLANLKIRKDLGIDTMIDLIKRDNPDMDDKAAEKKLMEILAEKMKHAAMFATPNDPNAEDPKPGDSGGPLPLKNENQPPKPGENVDEA